MKINLFWLSESRVSHISWHPLHHVPPLHYKLPSAPYCVCFILMNCIESPPLRLHTLHDRSLSVLDILCVCTNLCSYSSFMIPQTRWTPCVHLSLSNPLNPISPSLSLQPTEPHVSLSLQPSEPHVSTSASPTLWTPCVHLCLSNPDLFTASIVLPSLDYYIVGILRYIAVRQAPLLLLSN